jgi:phage terminase small subunit
MALTPKQQRFVAEYLIDLNATAAYKRAGYKGNGRSAENAASRLLGNVGVQAAIKEARDSQSQRLLVEADDVLRELLLLARSDLGDVLDFSGQSVALRPACLIPEKARRAIASIKVRRHTEGRGDDALKVEVVEFKLWDKLSALDKLGKYLGLWRDQLDLNLKGPPYKVYLGFDPQEALGQGPTSPPNDAPTSPEARPST